jgi:uncharacterized protein (DUF302 family)
VGIALTLAVSTMVAAQTQKGGPSQMKIQEVKIQRVSIVTSMPFDTVIERIDAQIGHPDMAAFRRSLDGARNEAEMKNVLDPITQPNGLMEFTRFDLGEILQKENGTDKPRIVRIVAGNPLIMKEMVKHVSDAGSYAPITILIEEQGTHVRLTYDRMASYLSPYRNENALRVARELDAKVERILRAAAE